MSKIQVSTTATEPVAPASGNIVIYADYADQHLKTKDSSGNIIDLTTGASTALAGVDGVTVISGTSFITISGFRSEFVTASGFIQNQISNLDATYATDAMVVSISGHLQTAIDAVEATDVDSLNGAVGALTLAGSNIGVSTTGQTITISAPVTNALISAGNITITSGTSTTSISAGVANALVGGSNITITSGTNTTTITAAQPPAIVAGNSQISVSSGTNTISVFGAVPNAIIGGTDISVVSGTNTITVNSTASVSSNKPLVGDAFISVVTGTNQINILADAIVAGSNISVVSGTSTVTITAAQPPALVAGQNIVITSGSNTITVAANPASAPALIGGSNITIVSGSNTTTIVAAQPPAIVSTDNFLNVVSGTNTITITPDAIISSTANLTVTSGTSTLTLGFSSTPSFTSVTATTITGTNFQAAGQISGQSGLFSTTVQGTTITGTTGQFSGQLTSQSAIVSTSVQAVTVQGTTVTGTSGQFAGTVSAQTGNYSTSLTVSGVPVQTSPILLYQFYSDQLESPVTSDWAVGVAGPAVADNVNSGLTVRTLDDTTEEGVGFSILIPTGMRTMSFRFLSKAVTAPAATRTVGLKLYNRSIRDNIAVSAWTAGTTLTDLSFPTNATFQYDTESRTLASWGLVAGVAYQFELTRVNPTAGTELVGDWGLYLIEVRFS